jgi:hypothetical protein
MRDHHLFQAGKLCEERSCLLDRRTSVRTQLEEFAIFSVGSVALCEQRFSTTRKNTQQLGPPLRIGNRVIFSA